MKFLFYFWWVLLLIVITPYKVLVHLTQTVVRLVQWVSLPPSLPLSQNPDQPRQARGYLRLLARIRAWHSSKLYLPGVRESSEQLEQRVMRVVSIGTPLAQAKQIMERNGFRCEYETHATFVRDADQGRNGARGETVLSDAEFLLCRKRRAPSLIVSHDWTCALEHKEGYVTRVFARTWLTGP
jgi:hypothetical protein